MKFGFIFPGYGNQFVGMAKELYNDSRVMQEYFEEAANCLDKNFVKLTFASSDADLAELENAYVSLLLVSISIAAILKEQGIEPSIVAGHDVGQFAALASVGGVSMPDAIYLLRKYAGLYTEFLKDHRVEATRVKNMQKEELQKVCDQCVNGNNIAYISEYESDSQSIVSGTIESLNCLRKAVEDLQSGPVQDLPIGGGLHSPLMDEVLKTMKMYLEKVDFKEVSVPFVASITGQALKDGESVRAAVMQQIHAPIQWKKAVDAFAFCDVIIIVGPGKALLAQIQEIYPDKKVFSVVTPEDLNLVLTNVGKEPLPKDNESDSSN